MSVLSGLLQYLQYLAGGLSAAICCHTGPISLNSNHEIIISNDLYTIWGYSKLIFKPI